MESAYLVLDIVFALTWGVLFYARPAGRREMLIVSCTLAPLGLIQPVLALDYFAPEYLLPLSGSLGAEDILFAFFAAGVGASLWDSISRVVWRPAHETRYRLLFLFYAMGLAIFFSATLLFGLSSILTGSALLLLAGSIHLALRRDLICHAIISSLLVATFLALAYLCVIMPFYPGVMETFWKSSYRLAGIPYEEFIWALAWGFYVGPMYKFMRGLRAGTVS